VSGLIAVSACILLAYLTLVLIPVARRRRLGHGALKVIGFGALACFIALNLSDWPSGWLSGFWRDHSIVGATIDTLLLGAVIYLCYRAGDLLLQSDLDSKIAIAGRAGVVDHLVEVDVALSLACASRRRLHRLWPDWDDDEWCEEGKALAWLRRNREVIHTDRGVLTEDDPRKWPITQPLPLEEWRRHLVDECLRRIMAAIRDWAVVLTRSRDGQLDLIKLGEIRRQLVLIDDYLEDSKPAEAVDAIEKCRRTCRQLAFSFEMASKPNSPRPEVVNSERDARPTMGAGTKRDKDRELTPFGRWWRVQFGRQSEA
jgi:hypothetical protein